MQRQIYLRDEREEMRRVEAEVSGERREKREAMVSERSERSERGKMRSDRFELEVLRENRISNSRIHPIPSFTLAAQLKPILLFFHSPLSAILSSTR